MTDAPTDPRIEILARMWIECDPNRMKDADDLSPLHVDGKMEMLPRWHWFIPRAEASLEYFSSNGFDLVAKS